MKDKFKKILAAMLALVMCFSLGACGGTDDDVDPDNNNPTIDEDEEINTEKTQLYVFNFAGGYGSDWLASVKQKYEEMHKDDVYEEGKKGIQIYVNNAKTQANQIEDSILDNRDEIYFTEYAYYYSMKAKGLLCDITDAVTADLSDYGDEPGSTIEKKLSAEQKSFYGVQEADGKTHYYALPHYSGYMGLNYNIDLFEEKGWYFKDGYKADADLLDKFIYDEDDVRTAGPDGVKGTDDDGLPATYEEFYLLCEFIWQNGCTPITWMGNTYSDYLTGLMMCMATDYEGLDQMMLNFTLNGTATTLGTANSSGFTKDATSTQITTDNIEELSRQQGKYYALEFMNKIVTNVNYHSKYAYNSSYSHMDAQDDFLQGDEDGKEIAMLVDGIWWESEATTTFNEMADSQGEEFSKKNRKFGYLPFPKATADKVGTKTTLFDHIYSMSFIKSNIADFKKPIAYDFIKFVNSQAQLVEFSQITDTPKALNYTMNSEELSKMSPYGRSVMKLKQNADIVYPYSTTPLYVNNQSGFLPGGLFASTIEDYAPRAFVESGCSVADYFTGMKSARINAIKDFIKSEE